jgi:hypothetical protein
MTVVTRATINGGCLQNNDISDNGKSLTTAKSLHDALAVPPYIYLHDALAVEPPLCTVGPHLSKEK